MTWKKHLTPILVILLALIAGCGLQYVPAGDTPAYISVKADGKLDMETYRSKLELAKDAYTFTLDFSKPLWRLKVQLIADDGTYRDFKPIDGMAANPVWGGEEVSGSGKFAVAPGKYRVRVVLYCHVIKTVRDGWTTYSEYIQMYVSWKDIEVNLEPGGEMFIELPDGSKGS